MSLKTTASILGLSCAALLACAAPGFAETTATPDLAKAMHPMTDMGLASRAIVTATTMPGATPKIAPITADGAAAAADNGIVDLPTSSTFRTAGDAAHDSATTATTAVCDAYFTQSQSLDAALGPAFQAFGKHDVATLGTMLPNLQTLLAGLSPTEVKAEACDGTHINAYSTYDFFELSVLRDHGVDTGLPAALPLVKQPNMEQPLLAFIVGWTLYEQKDFQGALAAYGKGLTMFPHDHGLQSEYASTLQQLQRGAQTVSYTESVLAGTYDLSDQERAQVFIARAYGLVMMGRLDEADASLSISLRYGYTDLAKQMRDQLRQARAAAQK
jgi:hypothetical protein